MKNWIFGGVSLALICAAISQPDFPEPYCPPDADLFPCYCSSDYLHSSVTCEKVTGIEKIQNALKATRGKNVSYAFFKARLGDIPSDLFDGQKSESLNFENCQIGSFGDRPFTGLEDTLNYLNIYGSVDKRRKDLETLPLGHLKKLTTLAFQGNDIKRLGNEWFRGGPVSLGHLMLEANDIEEVGDQAFSSLINVEQIWMGDNRFKEVHRSMFPRPANKLNLLEISFCDLEVIPEDLFEDMPALTDVNVSGNKLKSIPEATWGKIWDQLEELYLERNRGFQCDDNLKWIYKRNLPRILTGECADETHYRKKIADLKLSDFE